MEFLFDVVMGKPIWMWATFMGIVAVLLAFDLGGSLHGSFFTLFQIMTLEGWADIVREIMKTHPQAWIFFVIYILSATFTVLNLFIAVIVDAMQRQHQAEEQEEQDTIKRIEAELMRLHQKIDAMGK